MGSSQTGSESSARLAASATPSSSSNSARTGPSGLRPASPPQHKSRESLTDGVPLARCSRKPERIRRTRDLCRLQKALFRPAGASCPRGEHSRGKTHRRVRVEFATRASSCSHPSTAIRQALPRHPPCLLSPSESASRSSRRRCVLALERIRRGPFGRPFAFDRRV